MKQRKILIELYYFKVSYFDTKHQRQTRKHILAKDFKDAIKEAYEVLGDDAQISSIIKGPGKHIKVYERSKKHV